MVKTMSSSLVQCLCYMSYGYGEFKKKQLVDRASAFIACLQLKSWFLVRPIHASRIPTPLFIPRFPPFLPSSLLSFFPPPPSLRFPELKDVLSVLGINGVSEEDEICREPRQVGPPPSFLLHPLHH